MARKLEQQQQMAATPSANGQNQMKSVKLCVICGDKAKGINFNALTCMSCKAFFRRNALRNKDMKCPFNNSCQIDKITRKFCSRCRLKKCFECGMKKEWILSDEEKRLIKEKIIRNKLRKQQELEQQQSQLNHGQTTVLVVDSLNGKPATVDRKSTNGSSARKPRTNITSNHNKQKIRDSNNNNMQSATNGGYPDSTVAAMLINNNNGYVHSLPNNHHHNPALLPASLPLQSSNDFANNQQTLPSVEVLHHHQNHYQPIGHQQQQQQQQQQPHLPYQNLPFGTGPFNTELLSSPSSSTCSGSSLSSNSSSLSSSSAFSSSNSSSNQASFFTEPSAFSLDTLLTYDESGDVFLFDSFTHHPHQHAHHSHNHTHQHQPGQQHQQQNMNSNQNRNTLPQTRNPAANFDVCGTVPQSQPPPPQPSDTMELDDFPVSLSGIMEPTVMTSVPSGPFGGPNHNHQQQQQTPPPDGTDELNYGALRFSSSSISSSLSDCCYLFSNSIDSIDFFNDHNSPTGHVDEFDSLSTKFNSANNLDVQQDNVVSTANGNNNYDSQNNSPGNIGLPGDIRKISKPDFLVPEHRPVPIDNRESYDTKPPVGGNQEQQRPQQQDFSQYLLHDNDPIFQPPPPTKDSPVPPVFPAIKTEVQYEDEEAIVASIPKQQQPCNETITDNINSLLVYNQNQKQRNGNIHHHQAGTNNSYISRYLVGTGTGGDHPFSEIVCSNYDPILDPTIGSYELNPLSNRELIIPEKLLIQELSTACSLLQNPYKRILHLSYKNYLSQHRCSITEFFIHRLIRMAKRLSSFAGLALDDQVQLLKRGLFEMLSLRSVLLYDPDREAFSFLDDKCKLSVMVNVEVIRPCCIKCDYQRHKNLPNRFMHEWKSDHIIFDLLTAILLFTPRPELRQNGKIKQENYRYTRLLRRYLELKYSDVGAAKSAFARLMSCIDEIRFLNEDVTRLFLNTYYLRVSPLFAQLLDLKSNQQQQQQQQQQDSPTPDAKQASVPSSQLKQEQPTKSEHPMMMATTPSSTINDENNNHPHPESVTGGGNGSCGAQLFSPTTTNSNNFEIAAGLLDAYD